MSANFFESVIAAGAILTGFCGTFLAFRIQREASYFRQPALDFSSRTAKDVYVGLTRFSVALGLLLAATVVALIFGFVIPLLAIAGAQCALISPWLDVCGLLVAVVLLLGYLLAELVHYRIIRLGSSSQPQRDFDA